MKIILNRAVATSFCLSRKGTDHLSFLKSKQSIDFDLTGYHIARNDPDLVCVVEVLGAEAAGPKNELTVDIPENTQWRISDVAGYEFVIANGKIH